MKLLVCGGGNGAHVLAGLAASREDVEARVLTLFSDEAERWTNTMKEDGFTVIFHEDGKEARRSTEVPKLVTKDPKAAQDVDIIVLVVPAFSHAQYLTAIKPYISPGVTIIGLPGQAGFEFDVRGILEEKAKDCTLINFDTLPWACRIKEYGKVVDALGTKDKLSGAIQMCSVSRLSDPVRSFQEVLGSNPVLHVNGHILGMTLMGVNAYGHSAILYGRWKEYKGEVLKEAPLFYQGVDDFSADIMSKMSDEVLAIAVCVMKNCPDVDLSNVIHIFPFLLEAYPKGIKDKSSLKRAFNSNDAYVGLTHPMKKVTDGFVPDFGHRYVSEDIPFGLVVLRGIAEVVNVPTPAMDEVLHWIQPHMGKVYLKDGKLQGNDVKNTRSPQRYGFDTIETILGTTV